MQAIINSAQGTDINVTFTFDDGTNLTETISIATYVQDGVDDQGTPTIVTVDPSLDTTTFLENYANAYLAGLAAVTANPDITALIGKPIMLQVATALDTSDQTVAPSSQQMINPNQIV